MPLWLGAAAGSKRELLKLGGTALELGRCALKCFLSKLGVRDVLGDPDHADRLTEVIDDDLAAVAQRADPAVAADAPVLEREGGPLRNRPVQSFEDPTAVVGKDAFLDTCRGDGIEVIPSDSVEGEQPVGPGDPVVGDVPFPAPDPRDALGLCQPLPAAAQFAFHAHAIGDVADDRARTLLARGIVEDLRAHLDLDWRAVGAEHSRDAAGVASARARGQDARPALIGEVGQPLPAERADLGFGSAENLTSRGVRGKHPPVGDGEQDPVGAVLVQGPVRSGAGHLGRPPGFLVAPHSTPGAAASGCRALAQISLGCPLRTITTDSIDHPFWGARGRFNTRMNHSNHQASATSAGDSGLVAVIDRTPLGAEQDDRCRPSEDHATDGGLALLEDELLKLRKRYRARELALARMASAVSTLRRANRALNDENVLLRQHVAELGERASRTTMAQRPGPQTSGGK